jgi:tRNA (guanine-N7-)-methyltransferase
MKIGGKIYVISDVKDLFDWEFEHLQMHPLFEKVHDNEIKADPCIRFMMEGTDEAKKVIKNEGKMWYSVFRKRDINKDVEAVENEVLKFYF